MPINRTDYYKRCAFTGYRPSKMPWGYDENDVRCIAFRDNLYETLEKLIKQGYMHFLSGGAMGMDMLAAESILDLKEIYPWIMLEMVSPFDDQSFKWTLDYRLRLERLFASADIITATGHDYAKGCLFRRNCYLVDNAGLVLAAYDGQPGGTAMTVSYAQKKGVPVQLLRLNNTMT